MQLDKTRIAVRERNYSDILDLALRVIHAYPAQLFITCALGTLPFVALNYWLIGDLARVDYEMDILPWNYLFWTIVLVVWEMPLAALLTTLFLGQATFLQEPNAKQIRRDLLKSLPQIVLFQVIIRGVMVILFFTWFVLYCIWPYLNEVILLERNPLRTRSTGRMTTRRRSSALHAGSFGDLLGRWIVSVLVGVSLTLALWLAILVIATTLRQEWGSVTAEWDDWFVSAVYTVYLQAAIWIVVNFFAIVRFLSYLDLRIRREGWEVELMLRAEAARLARQLA